MAGAVVGPNAAFAVIMAGKIIDVAVVVDVHQVGALHEHGIAGQRTHFVSAAAFHCPNQFDAVVTAAGNYIIESVVVDISGAHTPLALVGNLSEGVIEKLGVPQLLVLDL